MSLLAFLTILAPGLIHIMVEQFYVIQQPLDVPLQKLYESGNIKEGAQESGKVVINVTYVLAIVMFFLLVGLVWALNDELRDIVIDFLWMQVNYLSNRFSTPTSSSSL